MYKVKLDIDGVLRDMEHPMMELYNAKFNTNITSIPTYDVDKAFPLLNGNAFEFFFDNHASTTIRYAKPYFGAAEAVHRLIRLNCEINIVSYQPSQIAKEYTLEWLDRNDIYYDNIIFANKPSKMIFPADIIIDDCIKYLDEDKNAFKICINQSYNNEWNLPISSNGTRCNDLASASKYLEDLFNAGYYIDEDYFGMRVIKKSTI